MKKSTELGLMFFSMPFVVSASTEFLPKWLSMPISLIATLLWIGTFVQITKYDAETDKVKE